MGEISKEGLVLESTQNALLSICGELRALNDMLSELPDSDDVPYLQGREIMCWKAISRAVDGLNSTIKEISEALGEEYQETQGTEAEGVADPALQGKLDEVLSEA